MDSSVPGTGVGRDLPWALGSRIEGYSLPSSLSPAQPHLPPGLFPVTPMGGCSLNGHAIPQELGDCCIMWSQGTSISFPFSAVVGLVAQAAFRQEGQGGGLA